MSAEVISGEKEWGGYLVNMDSIKQLIHFSSEGWRKVSLFLKTLVCSDSEYISYLRSAKEERDE